MREGTLREELQQGRARGGGSVLESMRTGVAFQRKSWRSRASCAVSRAPRSPVTLPVSFIELMQNVRTIIKRG
jgi:hypothetical protein